MDQSVGKKEHDMSQIKCCNCREKGHFRLRCPKPRKVTTDSRKPAEISWNPKKDRGPRTVSVVKEISDEEGAWAAYEIMEEVVSKKDWFEEAIREDNKMPGLVELSKSKDEELYDSGCTNHILPYKKQFQNFEDIVPRHFHAVNKQSFSTIGKGDLVIDIPNGIETSQLCSIDMMLSLQWNFMIF